MSQKKLQYLKDLRQRAQVRLKLEGRPSLPASWEEINYLVEDLYLHQAELEIQNQDLQELQQQLEAAKEEYRRLYESAPVGYFTLSGEGIILKANTMGLEQLGTNCLGVLNQPFTQYVARESQDIFFLNQRQLLKEKAPQSCELRLVKASREPFWGQLESTLLITEKEGYQIHMTLIDITARKEMEEENEVLLQALQQKSRQVQALGRRLAEVREQEQQRLARELHDRVGQNLTALGFQFDYLKGQLAGRLDREDPLYPHLDTARQLLDETTDRVRDLLAEIRPPVLDDYGLVAALEWYGERFAQWSGLHVTIHGEELHPRPAPQVENTLLRITQEALTNVAKHAQASEVKVAIASVSDLVHLVITDNGIGLKASRRKQPNTYKSWGLLIMSERAEMVGGLCRIDSHPGRGTEVFVEVPCEPPEE